jgi:hypothetical protein
MESGTGATTCRSTVTASAATPAEQQGPETDGDPGSAAVGQAGGGQLGEVAPLGGNQLGRVGSSTRSTGRPEVT